MYLFQTNPVVWLENRPKGSIIQLSAEDYDSEVNGAPFTFEIDSNAFQDIKTLFSINGNEKKRIMQGVIDSVVKISVGFEERISMSLTSLNQTF